MARFIVLILAISLVVLFLPGLSQAQGLVPCGGESQDPCTLCHLVELVHNIIELILTVFIPLIAVLFVAWGGFVFLTSAGDPGRQSQGKTILMAVLIGFLIIYGSWIFLNLLLNFFGVATWGGTGNWWEIQCQIEATQQEEEENPSPEDDDEDETPPEDKIVFISSQTYQGKFGEFAANNALQNADQECRQLAQAQDSHPATKGKTWRAWLSTFSLEDGGGPPGVNARERITDASYYLVDGTLVATGIADLLTSDAEGNYLQSSIRRNEKGSIVTGFSVWTGTKTDGTVHNQTCNNWSSDASSASGIAGADSRKSSWTDATPTPPICNTEKRIYCFEE